MAYQFMTARGQRSAVRGQDEATGIVNHCAKHLAHFCGNGLQLVMTLDSDVATILREIRPSVGLAVLPVSVCKLAHEVGWVTALCPSFSQIRTNRAGRSSHLVSERVAFFGWKTLTDLKDPHGKCVSFFVHRQFRCRANLHLSDL